MSCSTTSRQDVDLKLSEMPLSSLSIQPVALNRTNFTLPVEIQLEILRCRIDNIVYECAIASYYSYLRDGNYPGKGKSDAKRQIRVILEALPGLRSDVREMLVTKRKAAKEELNVLDNGHLVEMSLRAEAHLEPQLTCAVDLLAHLIEVTAE